VGVQKLLGKWRRNQCCPGLVHSLVFCLAANRTDILCIGVSKGELMRKVIIVVLVLLLIITGCNQSLPENDMGQLSEPEPMAVPGITYLNSSKEGELGFVENGVEMRMWPGIKDTIVNVIPAGTLVKLLDKVQIESENKVREKYWYYVEYIPFDTPMNVKGWIKADEFQMYTEDMKSQVLQPVELKKGSKLFHGDEVPDEDDFTSYVTWMFRRAAISRREDGYIYLDFPGGENGWTLQENISYPLITYEYEEEVHATGKGYVEGTEIIQLWRGGALFSLLLNRSNDDTEIVQIDNMFKYHFNKLCNDMAVIQMPGVEDGKFDSPGFAMFYLFYTWNNRNGYIPDTLSKESMELSLQKLFTDGTYQIGEFEHRTYGKAVAYDDIGYYHTERLMYDMINPTIIYDPINVTFKEANGGHVMTATMRVYHVDTTGGYSPGENELALRAKAEQLGLSWVSSLMYLFETGGLEIFEVSYESEIELFIDNDLKVHILKKVIDR
jgi:hypothetical protein